MFSGLPLDGNFIMARMNHDIRLECLIQKEIKPPLCVLFWDMPLAQQLVWYVPSPEFPQP